MPFPLLTAAEDPDAPRASAPEPLRAAPPTAEPERRSAAQRFVLALLLIATAALIGYVLSRPTDDASDPDALARSVAAAGRLQFVLDTEDPLEARQFIRAEFGWRVGVPVFEEGGPQLRGVAVAQVAPAVEVPVFVFADSEEAEVAVFVYSYALFDQVPDRLRLAPSDYEDLAGGDPTVRHVEERDVLLWRDRDDIYVAVMDGSPAALADGLTMAR